MARGAAVVTEEGKETTVIVKYCVARVVEVVVEVVEVAQTGDCHSSKNKQSFVAQSRRLHS